MSSVVSRLFRGVLAVLILTAFVLGIAYSIRELSSINVEKLAHLASPYLAKVGISDKQIGMVAGNLIERATDVGIEGVTTANLSEDKDKDEEKVTEDSPEEDISSASTQIESSYEIAIIADSHIANDKEEYKENKNHLDSSLAVITDLEISEVIHVGDVTNWGVVSDLKDAKEVLDNSELAYYVLPGDRDLAQAVGPSNFKSVFGKTNQVLVKGENKFVLFDNSANYTLISQEDIAWFEKNIEDADFVILSQPLSTEGLTLFNCQYMGNSCKDLEDEILSQKQQAVREQKDVLLEMVRTSSVKAIIAGDHHKSSKIEDTQRPSLTHYVVGAVGGTVSEYAQSSLQTQRFSLLKLFDDGSYVLDDVVLD